LVELSILSEEKKEFMKKLSPFEFGPTPGFVNEEELVEKELNELDNGKKYFGQSFNKLIHGKGVIIWPIGGLYIGWWKFGMATGKGRFIT